jgi:methyltransferase (TIGR00027 family)
MALATATVRALAFHDPREKVRGPDYLAELFLNEEQKAPLRDARIREHVMKNKVAPGAYEFMISRTAFFDRLVCDALANDLPQLVLLGAGYDSRPYRFRHLLGNARVYELDAPATQARKKEMLERGGVDVPASVRFIAIDFANDDLAEVLLAAGFSPQEQALFVWEGVTYYLSLGSVDNVLAALRSIAPRGSSVGFDFAFLSPEAPGEDGIKKLRQQMQSDHPAEPTHFGIPQGKLEGFLSKRGYAVVEVLEAAEMEARYLALADGSTAGKVPALFSLVHAALV